MLALKEPRNGPLAQPSHGSTASRSVASPATLKAIRAGAAEGRERCRFSDDALAAMRADGLFRSLQPRRFGGREMDLHAFFETQMDVAQADMSAGWLFGVMGVLAFHLALFSPEAQTDVWGDDPDVLMASSYMQTGRATASAGGVTLSGQWRFASGADHAEWFLLGGKIERPDGDEAAVFLVPRSDLTIDTIWQPPGLRATGSQDLRVAARFVPAHRIHPIRERFRGDSPGLKVNTAPVYRVPLPQLLVRVISVPAIGALRAGLASLVNHNACRRDIAGQAVANNPSVQLIIGQVAADLNEMEVTLAKALQRLMDAAHDGRELPIRDRMLLRLQATRIADRCCGLMHKVFIAAGASGLSASSPFGGILADIQAARQHAANQFEPFALALGANLLGLEQEDTLL